MENNQKKSEIISKEIANIIQNTNEKIENIEGKKVIVSSIKMTNTNFKDKYYCRDKKATCLISKFTRKLTEENDWKCSAEIKIEEEIHTLHLEIDNENYTMAFQNEMMKFGKCNEQELLLKIMGLELEEERA